jgi:hypothetical protein
VAAGSGLVTGMTKVDEMVPESCWNLFEAAGVPQWRKDRCDYTLGRFSPDERLMLGHPTYRDGPGDRVLAILDAETGRAFVEYNAEEMSLIADAVWEDETHVLATVYGEDGWHVMRLDTEGTMVDVSGPLPGAELETPVQFGAAP